MEPPVHARDRLTDLGIVRLDQRREYHPIETEFSLVRVS